MKPGFFIDRPVFSIVISVLIVIGGLLGVAFLPIDQYPQITPPVVKISASYPGASALTVSQAVATPIEQELNGTPGMIYMQSSCTNSGNLTITVTFDVSSDADMAAVEIQNRVKLAESRLPAEVIQNGISVEKQSPSQLMTLTLMSDDPKFDEIYLSNFATINVLDVLRRIPGVGRVSNVGSRYYGMQIWIYPDRMANMGLTLKDIQNALKDQNRESAAGEIGKQPVLDVDVTMPVTASGRLSTVEEFENIVIKANPDGTIVRMRDVARVSLEASSYNTESGINGKNAAILAIYMLPGANAMEVAENVKNAMKDISKNFPDGMEYNFPFDMTEYISQSIHEVYKTLFEALFLVVIVVFFSLQNWRAALIPIIAVPISLIGTFAFMLMMGFSLNTLTLLGLVLAIGIVVDDAIVVVENVERIMKEEGLPQREATHKAMKELTGALVATSLVLAAVFVPVSFLEGITGLLYRQFSITIVILRPEHKKKAKVFKMINYWLATGNRKYAKILRAVLGNPRRVLAGFGMIIVAIVVLNRLIPTSFIPEEDQGYFTVELEMPEGTALERTREVTNRAIEYLKSLPAVAYVQNVTGSSSRVGTSQSRATLTVILKPWEERKGSGMGVADVMEEARKEFYYYPEVKTYISRPPVIPGLGESGGIEMQLEARGDASWEDLISATDTFLLYASQAPELRGVSSALQSEIPQGTVPRHTDCRHIQHDESLFRLCICQRLQYVQPHIPRVHTGGSSLPCNTGKPEHVLSESERRRNGAADGIRDYRIHHWSRHYQTLQHVHHFGNQCRGRSRLQYRRRNAGNRADSGRTPARQHRNRMERTVISGKTGKRANRCSFRARATVRVPVPCGTIRKLDSTDSSIAFNAYCSVRSIPRNMGLRS